MKTFARLEIVYLEEAVLMAIGDEALKALKISKRLGTPAYSSISGIMQLFTVSPVNSPMKGA